MLSIAPDFTLSQLANLPSAQAFLRTVGLRARLMHLDTGETVAIYRPRDPDYALWLLSPTTCGRVNICGMCGAAMEGAWDVADLGAAAGLIASTEGDDAAP